MVVCLHTNSSLPLSLLHLIPLPIHACHITSVLFWGIKCKTIITLHIWESLAIKYSTDYVFCYVVHNEWSLDIFIVVCVCVFVCVCVCVFVVYVCVWNVIWCSNECFEMMTIQKYYVLLQSCHYYYCIRFKTLNLKMKCKSLLLSDKTVCCALLSIIQVCDVWDQLVIWCLDLNIPRPVLVLSESHRKRLHLL